ncbi:putative quinone-oxidoreductase, chloroplastic [Madurella mycetomatis]|uniref:Quinone-oxidoreductase, chloroplastic n=1 Tax=Madurella mycetomatis TaxID=100816 RepID=A0A175W398_9PEZI|nr:putative quinone-oxidoreductase, chloroplastic [Madurella mycetomatis]
MAIPQTMKAWTTARTGTPRQALSFQPSIPTPSLPPSSSLLLVKVTHAALNPVDLALLKTCPPWLPFRHSPTPAMDFAGEVVAAGSGALLAGSPVALGTRVAGAIGLREVATGKGSLAEYVAVDVRSVAVVPDGMDGKEAAGLMGIAGQTAAAMVRNAGFGIGDGTPGRVLVNGASGGVGSVAVQALKGMGKEVVAVCSGGNADMMRRLGADEVIDYRVHSPLERHLVEKFGQGQFDAILDCVGNQALFTHSPDYLKKDGRFVSIVGGWSQGVIPFVRNKLIPVFLGGIPRSYTIFLLIASGETAKEVAGWVERGLIRQAPIDSEFSMEQAVEAYEKLATGRAKGKIVIKVGGPA